MAVKMIAGKQALQIAGLYVTESDLSSEFRKAPKELDETVQVKMALLQFVRFFRLLH